MITDKKHFCDCEHHMIGICCRTQGDERRFTEVKAHHGKVDLTAWLDGRYEAAFDVSPEEAYELAEKLVEQAEVATMQRATAQAKLDELRLADEARTAERRAKRIALRNK